MTSPLEIYPKFVESMNARDWEATQSMLADDLTVNGVQTNSQTLVAQLQSLGNLGPDISSSIDFVIADDSDPSKAFSRVIHRLTLAQDAMGAKATGNPAEFAEQSIFWAEGGKITKIYTISDFEDLRKGTSSVPKAQIVEPKSAPNDFDIEASFRSNIDSFNNKTMEQDLPKYCHPVIIFNGVEIELDKFRELLMQTIDFMEGISFTITDTVVNKDKQQIAARILYKGKPVKEFRGVEPTGKSVDFAEHCFYQFDEGKIKQMVSLMDIEVFRQMMSSE
ncbi:snoaL-like polyketide cyclase domain-containing protein [Sarocladium implicatum]|nr:snoaL-like polyketide cyclase domain-containing protein [Sarocladium implicatum]